MPYARSSFFDRFSNGNQSPGRVYDGDQGLGSKVGSCDIQCTLNGRKSRWTSALAKDSSNQTETGAEAAADETAGIRGLLYFSISFEENGVLLQTGTIRIDVANANSDPLPIFEDHAPSTALTGDPTQQHVEEDRGTDPKVAVNAGVGGELSGFSRGRHTDRDELHSWNFYASRSGHAKKDTRLTKAAFTRVRTLSEDHTGSNRIFEGALVVSRERNEVTKCNEPITLAVSPMIRPWSWGHRWFRPSVGSVKHSSPLGPGKMVSGEEFDGMLQKLQDEICCENNNRAATQIPNTRSFVPSTTDLSNYPSTQTETTSSLEVPPSQERAGQ